MKILITGGGGFQGSHLSQSLLEKGHEISVLNTHSETALRNITNIANKINLIWGDINDAELVKKSAAGQNVIFHLAGNINVDESLRDPLSYFNNNILGTYNILEAVKANNSRLIFISTCEVYGDGHDREEKFITESTELRPKSPYAASKTAADRMCYAYFSSYNVDVTIVRPFNIYGERQKSGQFGALIPILVSRALKGENLVVFGDGTATRDYTHVSDIVRGYEMVLNNKSLTGKVVNFGSGESARIKDIAEYIAKKTNVKVVYGPPRPGEVTRLPADISFAKSLGYAPRVNIWEGIDRYIEWAQN